MEESSSTARLFFCADWCILLKFPVGITLNPRNPVKAEVFPLFLQPLPRIKTSAKSHSTMNRMLIYNTKAEQITYIVSASKFKIRHKKQSKLIFFNHEHIKSFDSILFFIATNEI